MKVSCDVTKYTFMLGESRSCVVVKVRRERKMALERLGVGMGQTHIYRPVAASVEEVCKTSD
jgi:hypothetical protein